MDLPAVEVEEMVEEEVRVVTNVSMMNTMLGHIRLPGQAEDEELDLMMVETEEEMSKYSDVRQPGGSDILTGLFFSLLAFRSEYKETESCKKNSSQYLRHKEICSVCGCYLLT